jgi:hypothetical protein
MTKSAIRSLTLILFNLLGIIGISSLAYHLFLNAFGELKEMDGLGVLVILLIVTPFFLSYIFLAIFGLPYCLRAIYSGINRRRSFFYAACILCFPFSLTLFSNTFFQAIAIFTIAVFAWSLMTSLILLPRANVSYELKLKGRA